MLHRRTGVFQPTCMMRTSLIGDPACEMNERGTRDKTDGNEVVDNCDLPLDLELTGGRGQGRRRERDDCNLPLDLELTGGGGRNSSICRRRLGMFRTN